MSSKKDQFLFSLFLLYLFALRFTRLLSFLIVCVFQANYMYAYVLNVMMLLHAYYNISLILFFWFI